jgi:drug/metabolite transporter (DMT)-like permease
VIAGARARHYSAEVPLGLRYMVLSALSFSVMGVLVKLLGTHLPTQQIVLGRSVITLAISYSMLRRAGLAPWGSARAALVLRGVLGFAALSAVFFALTRLPLAEATVIQYIHPVFVAALSVLLLGERVRWPLLLAFVASSVGVVLVSRPGFLFDGPSHLDPLGALVGLAGALFTAAAYVLVRRLGAEEHPLVIVFYFPLVAIPLSLPLALWQWVWPNALDWLALCGVGLFTQLGQVCLTWGLHYEEAARASSVSYLQIVFAAVWGVLFFREQPDHYTAFGSLLIFAATLLAARVGQAPSRRSAERAAQ